MIPAASSSHLPLAGLLATALLLPACVGPNLDYGEIRTVEVMEANPGGYRLSAGDQIEVVFAFHPERNIRLTVRPDGKVSMPFAEDFPHLISGLIDGLRAFRLEVEAQLFEGLHTVYIASGGNGNQDKVILILTQHLTLILHDADNREGR